MLHDVQSAHQIDFNYSLEDFHVDGASRGQSWREHVDSRAGDGNMNRAESCDSYLDRLDYFSLRGNITDSA